MIKNLSILVTATIVCSFNINADPLVDSPGTWVLWNMDTLTNVVTEAEPPWHIPDDDSIYPGRNNDLILGSDKNVIVSGGVYGNALYFDGLNRYSSETMPTITSSGNWNEMIINLTFNNGRQDKITVKPTNIEFETN